MFTIPPSDLYHYGKEEYFDELDKCDIGAHTLTMFNVPSGFGDDNHISLTDFYVTEYRANQDLTPDKFSMPECWWMFTYKIKSVYI